jgi:hypothetical protein
MGLHGINEREKLVIHFTRSWIQNDFVIGTETVEFGQLLAYFPYFEKIIVSLRDHHAV